MEGIVVNAEIRTKLGKSAARKIRTSGKIPAVIYGKDVEPLHVSVDLREWRKLHRQIKKTMILNMRVRKNGGYEERPVMLKEIQYDHLGDRVLHIDFLQVSLERPVEVDIAIHLVGEPIGVKKGGIIEQHLHTVTVECLPTNIPERIDVDISNLDIGDSIHLNEINIPGVTILGSLDVAIATVVPPTLEEEAGLATEAPEPERIEKHREKEKE